MGSEKTHPTFDMREIIRSKQALRRRLAAKPIADKLRLLDELRERILAIRRRPREAAPTSR